jgi:stage II sporulation protein D
VDFVVQGFGWGHGVGMSQYGAQGYALHGWGTRRILAHYYPGTTLVRTRPRPIRVLLTQDAERVRISARSAFLVRGARGRTVRISRPALTLTLPLHVAGRTLRPPFRFVAGGTPLRLDGRSYRGDLVVHELDGRIAVVNELPLERYLRGVVPWEMPWYWQPHALEAQAVAARSYALAVGRQGQMYGGIEAERATTNRAVGATAGQVLTWRGRPALTYYSSTSGGRTAAVTDAFPNVAPVPYLVAVSDPYDALSPHHRWGPKRFRRAQLARRLGVPAVRTLTVRRNASGRVAALTVAWSHGKRTLSGGEVEHLLKLPSTWFVVHPSGTSTPAREHGYLAILASLPAGSSSTQALAWVRREVPEARAAESSEFPALRPGLLVVCAGPYARSERAAAVARRVPGAYIRHV